jgi:hypothetical protein
MASAHPKLPSDFQITDVDAAATTKSKELRISNLYASCDESSPNGHKGFGADSPIYSGPDLKEKDIVAYAHGLHFGQCHNSFTIAFEIDG